MLRGIIFDFDGVIVDSHPAHQRAWTKVFKSMGREVSDKDLKYILDGRTREEIIRHFCGELDAETIAEYGHRKEQMFREEAATVRTVRGLESFLGELNGAQLALAIASSGSRTRVSFLLSRLDLAKHFRSVVTADDVARGKPDPALFLKAAEDLHIDPAELLVFEDADSGVKAARSAGIRCVGISNGNSSSLLLGAGASHVVKDFRSLSYSKLQSFFAPAS
jgi:beta-phosphoglucomutase family hydrolase